jgi:magnesium-protoporphyrin IX monomethyl ester (oxidative) cyclase
MLKVLLINPPQVYCKGSMRVNIHFPIGLMYIAAMVRNVCHVEIFDCLASDFETEKDNLISCGAPPNEIRKVIEEKKPDVVGISVQSTAQYKNAELVALICKEVNPKIITVFGGPDPSVRFNSILENQYCDYCVVGEGEQTFYEFIKSLSFHLPLENIKGLAYKRNGVIHYEPRIFTADLDEFPFPAFDLIDMDKYLHNKNLYRNRSSICENSISVITSRGCPNSCVFCSIRLHMGQRYRAHSPAYVIKLLKLCVDKYGITNFHFEDDNLTYDKRRFEAILDGIIKENLQIRWDTPNGVRADTLNYNILKKMKQSGCIQITLAIESGNQRVLDQVIKKKTKLEYMIEIVKYCKELKIPANSFYVIGFPGETINEMKDTINLAIKLYREYHLLPAMLVATPLYGTELYEICMRDKLIKGNPTFEELLVAIQIKGNPMISTPDFSQEDVKQLINEFKRKLSTQERRYLLTHPKNLAPEFVNRVKIFGEGVMGVNSKQSKKMG